MDLRVLDLVVLKVWIDVRVDVLVVLDLVVVIVGYRHGHWHGHVHCGVEWHAAGGGWRARHMLGLLRLIEAVHLEFFSTEVYSDMRSVTPGSGEYSSR